MQDQVHSMDVPTMIMYNRAMTQLGLCAFRSGLIQESHACLAELYGSNRIRELLAQGMSLNRFVYFFLFFLTALQLSIVCAQSCVVLSGDPCLLG